MRQSKTFIAIFLSFFLLLLAAFAYSIYWADPYFHYHAPAENTSYLLTNERYQNDGITRNFSYDAIITGTSKTQNFKTSEFDALFDVTSIKISYSGASYKEINDALVRAISYNSDISVIVRGLDLYNIKLEKDTMRYSDYPTYLYDENIFNDVHYLLNKDILFGDVMDLVYIPTKLGLESTSFDEYSNWNSDFTYGAESVLSNYTRSSTQQTEVRTLTQANKTVITENITQNVLSIAQENPDITFYYFYMPYSIVYYDELNQKNEIDYFFDSIAYATSLLVDQENIYLISFLDDYPIITNLDNYKDTLHYSEDINSYMLLQIKAGE